MSCLDHRTNYLARSSETYSILDHESHVESFLLAELPEVFAVGDKGIESDFPIFQTKPRLDQLQCMTPQVPTAPDSDHPHCVKGVGVIEKEIAQIRGTNVEVM